MARVWYIAAAVILWALIYQGFFRYDYTMKDGYAIARHDRLTGKTCGIPDCLPPTPTPVPKPTVFDPQVSYREWSAIFERRERGAIVMVRHTQFAQELMHSPGAKKFGWTVQWADEVDEHLFDLHDPAKKHALPITQDYIDSLRNPNYTVMLVCFCDTSGAGFRWEVHTTTRQIVYVNDNPTLEKKYGLVDV